jgi:hypothetical protein
MAVAVVLLSACRTTSQFPPLWTSLSDSSGRHRLATQQVAAPRNRDPALLAPPRCPGGWKLQVVRYNYVAASAQPVLLMVPMRASRMDPWIRSTCLLGAGSWLYLIYRVAAGRATGATLGDTTCVYQAEQNSSKFRTIAVASRLDRRSSVTDLAMPVKGGNFQKPFTWSTVAAGVSACMALGMTLCYMRLSAGSIVSNTALLSAH